MQIRSEKERGIKVESEMGGERERERAKVSIG